MNAAKLIEILKTFDPEMEVGTTNYYGIFGPVMGAEVETAESESWAEPSYDGKQVIMLDLALDMQ